ncbi:MAG: T9SS type A sorting domain-containing protein [Candidatus Marinimicrobia bacterium]|nr:T9SS type A sorting domain-containing protein [Candidatus Neomarinimicrobiota bacterium]
MKKYAIFLLLCLWFIIPLHSEIVPPTEGQTQLFWVYGQGFFTGYYPITATCRKIGDSYYIFTEDALINDISISPTNSDNILISTTSGLYVSYDGGVTWQFVSGSGTKIISPDYNGANYPEGDLPIVHRTSVDVAFFMRDGEWWCGFENGIYQSKDNGGTWSPKTRGLPNYYDVANEKTVYPPFYQIKWDSRVTDFDANNDFYACSQAGLFYFKKSKFINIGGGLPKTSGDWDHLAVFDFFNIADTAYIGTELGVYKGVVNIDGKKAAWMPLGGGTATVDSSVYDTTSSALKIYLSGVEQNTYVNIIDADKDIYWSAKVRKEGNVLFVGINADNIYYSDATVYDPSGIDYAGYDNIADISVFLPSNIRVSKIYVVGNDEVYYLSETGLYKVSTESVADTVYDFGIEVYDLAVNNGKFYIAAGNGLFSSDLSDLSSWMKETGLITAGATDGDTLNYDVRSIAFDTDGDLYIGCHKGGLMKKDAVSGNWINLNIGLAHRDINPEKVNHIAEAFDSLAIHNTITTWFGDLPDVDGDAKQYCLIADMQDMYYLDAGDGVSFIDGYFNPVDQLSKTEDSNSNQMDMIYIDSNPLDLTSTDAYAAIANALTIEVLQTQEVPEDEWVVRGMAELGEWIAGLKDTSLVYTIGSNNNLITVGDIVPTVKDYEHNFVFFDYLYSHYLNTAEKMKAFVTRTETGMEGIEAELATLGGPTFKQLYNDFATAVHFDMLDLPGVDVKYTFPDIKVTHGSRIFDWGFGAFDSPYITPQTAWSTIYYITAGWDANDYFWCPGLSDMVTFNGENEASFDFSVIKQKEDDFVLSVMDLDNEKIGRYSELTDFGRADINDHSRPYQTLYFIVNVYDTPDPAGTSHVIHDAVTATEEFAVGFNHNVGAPDYLNIFCYTDDRIYDDAGKARLYDSDGDAIPDLEGPIGYLILDGDTSDIALSHFYIDDDHADIVYSKIIDLATLSSEATDVKVELFGENLSSSDVSVSSSGTLVKINSGMTTNLSIADNAATVKITEGTIAGRQRISSFVSKGDLAKQLRIESELKTPISDVLFIGPVDAQLKKPVSISIKVDLTRLPETADAIPIVFRSEKGQLVPVASAEQATGGYVRFETDCFGTFQVYYAKETVLADLQLLPNTFALKQNYPNPFNSSTAIRYQLPRTADVRIEVYNLIGEKVRTLYRGVQAAGYYTTDWNGLSDTNRLLPSGVYIYRMISDEFTATEKMMYLK